LGMLVAFSLVHCVDCFAQTSRNSKVFGGVSYVGVVVNNKVRFYRPRTGSVSNDVAEMTLPN
jgi:hypothetical protein